MAVTDWTNPCQRAAALTSAYYEIIAGGSAASIEYAANGVSRKVTFSFSNVEALRRQMIEAEDQCAIATGGPRRNRRFAIGSGARRRGWGKPVI